MSLFENQSPEVIRSRILSRLETSLQTREGSFLYDTVSPVSFEIWRLLMTLDELICAFYVDENSGKYLDLHADLLGLARRLGTKATAVIRFSGRDGVVIPAGTEFFTEAGLQFNLVYDVTLENGSGTGYLQAADVGDWYNIADSEITQILRTISGLDSYENEAAAGGTDPESDAALFQRIDYKRKNPCTSGNENHYKEWALSRDGVGGVKVTGLWKGPGTVRVLIVGYDHRAVDEAVVLDCHDFIQTQRPVGADVTVVTAGEIDVSIAATVVLRQGAAIEQVQAAFVSKLDTYLQSLAAEYFKASRIFDYPLYYNKVASILMGIDGVVDFTDLTVNGSTENVMIDGTSVPVLGGVGVNA